MSNSTWDSYSNEEIDAADSADSDDSDDATFE